MPRLFRLLRAFWSLTWGLSWVALLHWIWKWRAPEGERWVIGGHRGRHYGDNAAAVEAEARRQGKDITWIANPELVDELRSRGLCVLPRQSWAARRAISQASVLIYSHGEDDLDLQLILLRGGTAKRIYLNHCLHLLKGGGVTEPSIAAASWPVRAFRTWLITRWDHILPSSAEEKENLQQCYPMNPFEDDPVLLCGGAHLDFWRPGLEEEVQKRIYWFPTFRDTGEHRARLATQINEVIHSERLKNWLVRQGYELFIGAHINTGEANASLQPPFFKAQLSSLTEDARRSELLISDYSGVLFDYLLLERPVLFFAFDLEEYLEERFVHGSYENLDFGIHVRTSEQLISAIVDEKWRAESLQRAAVARRNRSLPAPCDSFSERCVGAITSLLQRD